MSLRVANTDNLGRVLVACKPFAVGDVLLQEVPLLTWPFGEWAAYLDRLWASDDAVRDAVLGLFRPELDLTQPAVLEARAKAERLLPGRPEGLDIEFAHAALLVAELNSHSFENGKRMAIFDIGSKAAHSCAPNAAYSSRDVPGHLSYKAIKPIAAADHVTFSYIADLFNTPTEGRRAELESTKRFACHCERCDAPDPLRALSCPRPGCNGMVMPNGSVSYDIADEWVCSQKGCDPALTQEDLDLHFKEEDATNDALQAAGGSALSNVDLEIPTELEACVHRLPRVHTISIQGFKLFGTVLAIRADDAKEQGDVREQGLWVRAAAAKLEAVRSMECVAASCDGQCDPSPPHPAAYQLCLDVLQAGQDLANGLDHDADVVAPLAFHVSRYIPMMFVMWPHLKLDASMLSVLNSVKAAAVE
jgi:hypothetical protein